MMRYLLPLGVFLAIGVLLFLGLGKDPSKLPSVLIGRSVPEFSLASLEQPDRILALKDLKGKPAIINIWATWCYSCRAEHEVLVAISKHYGTKIIGINYKDKREEALNWLAELGNPYAINIFDDTGRLGIDLGVYGTPETFLIDGNGIIRDRFVGPLTMQDWQTRLQPQLDQLK